MADKPQSSFDKAAATAKLNDEVRQQIHQPDPTNQVFLTPGIVDLIGDTSRFRNFQKRAELLRAIRDFDGFSADKDPYGERDFGSLDFYGTKVFWKIDYYDRTMQSMSPDPTDRSVTRRVLTILLADEY